MKVLFCVLMPNWMSGTVAAFEKLIVLLMKELFAVLLVEIGELEVPVIVNLLFEIKLFPEPNERTRALEVVVMLLRERVLPWAIETPCPRTSMRFSDIRSKLPEIDRAVEFP